MTVRDGDDRSVLHAAVASLCPVDGLAYLQQLHEDGTLLHALVGTVLAYLERYLYYGALWPQCLQLLFFFLSFLLASRLELNTLRI